MIVFLWYSWRWILANAAILAAITPLAYAQVDPSSTRSQSPARDQSESSLRSLPITLARDELQIWTSPFRTSSYSSHAVKKYVIPFALISAGLIASDIKTAEFLPNTSDQTKWSGRVSQLGASYSLAGFSGATLLLGQMTHNDHVRETGLLSLEALAHAQVVTFGLKQLTNRERPLDFSGRRGFWGGGDAFPSGHAASSFAVATVFAYEYRNHIAVPITAYTVASLISASRLSAQRHWVSDIFVGGSAGFLLGRFVYKRHHNPDLPGSPVQPRNHLMPSIDIARTGVSLAWRW